MIYLLTKTPDKVENKVVELVIFKLIHLINQTRFFKLDPGWQLLLLQSVLAPPVHVDGMSFNLVGENKSTFFKVSGWLLHVETSTEELIGMESFWERIPLV